MMNEVVSELIKVKMAIQVEIKVQESVKQNFVVIYPKAKCFVS